jgi:RNase H-fold protein (predicted Holliday junction resolvase)
MALKGRNRNGCERLSSPAYREATALPATSIDERLSSSQAARGLQASDVQPSRNKGAIDAEAARLLLI